MAEKKKWRRREMYMYILSLWMTVWIFSWWLTECAYFSGVVHEVPAIGSDGESEEASGASDEVTSPVNVKLRQNKNRRITQEASSMRLLQVKVRKTALETDSCTGMSFLIFLMWYLGISLLKLVCLLKCVTKSILTLPFSIPLTKTAHFLLPLLLNFCLLFMCFVFPLKLTYSWVLPLSFHGGGK